MDFAPLYAQLDSTADHGWLTNKLLGVTLSSAEWVVWLLVALSVASIAVIFERIVFFSGRRVPTVHELAQQLARGELDAAKASVAQAKGMEALVIRQALDAAPLGVHSVEEVIAATIARERQSYERFLGFLGTLGSNAPFVGLFGTVLGIIKAFHDLGASGAKGAAIQQTVMSGISEALVATAVGLAVAIPAVVAYNGFTRAIKNLVGRTTSLGHILVGYLKSTKVTGR